MSASGALSMSQQSPVLSLSERRGRCGRRVSHADQPPVRPSVMPRARRRANARPPGRTRFTSTRQRRPPLRQIIFWAAKCSRAEGVFGGGDRIKRRDRVFQPTDKPEDGTTTSKLAAYRSMRDLRRPSAAAVLTPLTWIQVKRGLNP